MSEETKTATKGKAKEVAASAEAAEGAVDTRAAQKAEREAAAAAKKAAAEQAKAEREAAKQAKAAEREAAKAERAAAREAAKAERAAARAAAGGERGPNRAAVLKELAELGWDGPTSYTKTRLVEMVEILKAGGTIERAAKGRPAAEKPDAAA